jgi:D-tyrosyl-tRNA(Tyr) deacylase
MIALLQRVTEASVEVDKVTVAEIETGLLALIGVEKHDMEATAERLIQRVLGYRMFADEQGRMNRSVSDISGGVLLVPQFTLAADTDKGMRASFSSAADPEDGRRLFDYAVNCARANHAIVESGRFGTDMQITLTNDGPVTFWLQVKS